MEFEKVDENSTKSDGMAKPCSHIFTKIYLIVFNLIFLICGGATLGVGIWMSLDKDTFMALQIVQNSSSSLVFEKLPYVMIGIGGAMMVVCFMGGCGACAESVCFLSFYSVILFLLLLAQIIVIVVAVVKKSPLQVEFSSKMREQVRMSYNRSENRDINKTDILTYAWDAMQVKLQCCGARGPGDYFFSTWYNNTKTGAVVPHTCCVLFNDNPEVPMVRDNQQCQIEGQVVHNSKSLGRYENVGAMEQLYTTGCVDAVLSWIQGHSHIFIAVLVTSFVLQIVSLVFSCFLIVLLKREHGKDWTDEDLREDK